MLHGAGAHEGGVVSAAAQRLAILAGHLAQDPHANHTYNEFNGGAGQVAVICGGVVLDVQVRQTPGGVARNMADALSQLVLPPVPAPALISVVGCDAAGQVLLDNLASLRLCLAGVLQTQNIRTASVCNILDKSGEVACCVADVAGPESHLTPSLLTELLAPVLPRACVLLIESNLSEAAITHVCGAAAALGVPIILEPVSVAKAVRAVGALQHLAWVTPNSSELLAIVDELCRRRGVPLLPRPQHVKPPGHDWPESMPADLWGLLPAAALLLNAGVQHILLTMGEDGAVLLRPTSSEPANTLHTPGCEHHLRGSTSTLINTSQPPHPPTSGTKQAYQSGTASTLIDISHVPAVPTAVTNLSGAGDTLVGALVAGLLVGASDVEAVAGGVAAAAATVRCTSNVAQGLSWECLREDMDMAIRGAVHLTGVLLG